jgi:hypothetical protein
MQQGSRSKQLLKWSSNECLKSWGATLFVFVCALGLFCFHNGFRLGLHPDEVSKIVAILQDRSYYMHPLFMTEAARFAIWSLGVSDPQIAVQVGRTLSALMGAIAVAALFLLLLRRAGLFAALVVSFAALTSPLLAVHAHYLKEDVWLLPFCVFSAITFGRLAEQPRLALVILLGIWVGLAVASKAVGVFLIPVLFVAAFLQAATIRGRLLKSVLQATAVAVVVVLLANLRMLLDYDRAPTELIGEIRHSATGHWDSVAFPLGYHLTHSLWMGLGPVLLILGLIGFVLTFCRWPSSGPVDRLMAVYALVYYAAIEASPLKPWPDAVRYALPLIVPLAYFAGCAIEAGGRWFVRLSYPRLATAAAGVAIAIALLPTAVAGVRLVRELEADTRLVAEKILTGKASQLVTESYGTFIGFHVRSLGMLTPQMIGSDIQYLVASSFLYDRFAIGASAGGPQNAIAAGIWAEYQAIFKLPHCEIRPRVMSYGFSNPTIQIIDLLAARSSGSKDWPTDTRACTEDFIRVD